MSIGSSVIRMGRATVRKLGVEALADYAKYSLQRLRRGPANLAYRQANPGVAFPPSYMLYEAYNLNYETYYEDGRETAATFAGYLRPYLREPGSKFLDWGCGPARLLRHMPEFLPAACDVHGVDVNPATVKWCQEALPELDVRLCTVQPPLPYEAGELSAVLGLSVLTHLSEAGHEAWLGEMARVLRPGGGLVVTTHGDAFRERLSESEIERYSEGGVFTRAFRREGHRLYGAYHPPAGFRTMFSEWFGEREHVVGGQEDWGIQQDWWVLERR